MSDQPRTEPRRAASLSLRSMRAGFRWLLHRLALVLAALLLLPVALTALYRFVPPPATPLMAIRALAGDGAAREWVALDALPATIPLALLAAEDNRFCQHRGFDWAARPSRITSIRWAPRAAARRARSVRRRSS